MLEAARKSCCISAFCETTQVARSACVNTCTAAASTIRPTAAETNSSSSVKPRLALIRLRRMNSSLLELRNVLVEHISLLHRHLRHGVINGDGDGTERG